MYKVVVKVGELTGDLKEIDVLMSYSDIYSASPQEAVESVIVQKKVKREDVVFVESTAVY